MKLIISIFLFALTAACHAEKGSGHTCVLTADNINLATPESDDIANTFWQKDKEGYESVARIHIAYKNGSMAVIEHKYCSMYNFEIAYYTSSKNELSDTETLAKTLKTFLAYSAIQDDGIYSAISAMSKRLDEKGFDANHAIAIAHNNSTKDNKGVEYSVSYTPIEDSSLHKAALFFYMGVGGEH